MQTQMTRREAGSSPGSIRQSINSRKVKKMSFIGFCVLFAALAVLGEMVNKSIDKG